MKLLVYIGVALIAAYLGYKISQYVTYSKEMKKNIIPIVDELKLELAAVEDKLKGDLSNEERAALTDRKNKILTLLGKFFGYSQQELETLLKTQIQ